MEHVLDPSRHDRPTVSPDLTATLGDQVPVDHPSGRGQMQPFRAAEPPLHVLGPECGVARAPGHPDIRIVILLAPPQRTGTAAREPEAVFFLVLRITSAMFPKFNTIPFFCQFHGFAIQTSYGQRLLFIVVTYVLQSPGVAEAFEGHRAVLMETRCPVRGGHSERVLRRRSDESEGTETCDPNGSRLSREWSEDVGFMHIREYHRPLWFPADERSRLEQAVSVDFYSPSRPGHTRQCVSYG